MTLFLLNPNITLLTSLLITLLGHFYSFKLNIDDTQYFHDTQYDMCGINDSTIAVDDLVLLHQGINTSSPDQHLINGLYVHN